LDTQGSFQRIDDKIERMARRLEELQSRNAQLEQRVEQLEHELSEREKQVDQLEAELNLVKFAQSWAASLQAGEDGQAGYSAEELKAYIDHLVQEIDNCLQLISD
jgi:predicted RNase H-like nuclease (RuvC/YqgF family)